MTTPLERLQGGYYNSNPVSEANPGGFADGGHVVNFPAAIADIAAVADGIVLDAEAIGEAGAQAEAAAESASAAAAARDEAEQIASGRTLRSGEGAPAVELGRNGDYYLDRISYEIYGPKAGVWGAGVSLLAPGTELGVSATHVRWRLEGGDWMDLVALDDLKGDDAEEISLQKTATHFQWRRGSGDWVDLIALSELQGAMGNDGNDGDDGQDITLQKTATHIQWRLGAGAWADLVALADLTPAVPVKASGAELQGLADDAKFATAKAIKDALARGTLNLAAPDLSIPVQEVTLTANSTLGAPTNVTAGTSGVIVVRQDATGGRTLAYNSVWRPQSATTPILTTTASYVSLLTWFADAAAKVRFTLTQGGPA